jgi:hypothetical protein
MSVKLRRYWFRFSPAQHRSNLGYGVTAFSHEDALSILKSLVFAGDELPAVADVIVDIDISTLDQHVRPNMEPPNWRGVWYPKGYASLFDSAQERLKVVADRRRYPCPCCGLLTLDEEPPGTFDICTVCGWEDDNVQFDDPDYTGGANTMSLNEAKKAYHEGRKVD